MVVWDMLKDFWLNAIRVLHFSMVIAILYVPFQNDPWYLVMYTMFVPFLMLHWVMNDNNCILTVVEKQIRRSMGQKEEELSSCFTCQIIEPVYDITKIFPDESALIYIITFLLWLVAVYRIQMITMVDGVSWQSILGLKYP
jgi:hypothetical protein